MADIDDELVLNETALDPEARARIDQIRWADVLIGIPSHRNGRTIGEVVSAVVDGISRYLPSQRVVLMNADGGSSDNTVRFVSEAVTPPNVQKLLVTYSGPMGKGTGVRAILEAATVLGVKACAVIEARAPGITAEWIPALINPIIGGQEVAAGCYQQSPYAASLTENLVYPFVRMVYNVDMREPLAGEFCVSGALAADLTERDVWETDVTRFGINVWVTLQAVVDDRRVVQVPLGYRGDGSSEPGVLGDTRLLHTVGTLFRFLAVHRRYWHGARRFTQVPVIGAAPVEQEVFCPNCISSLLEGFRAGGTQYSGEWQASLSAKSLRALTALMEQSDEDFNLDLDLWVRLVIEFAVIYNRGEGDPDKVVEAFLPVFYGRTASYMKQTQHLRTQERELVVKQIVDSFIAARPYFLRQWNGFQPWIDPTGY
ncbi:MAG: glycosyltransferase family protein [Anaerolineae bacterium]